VPCELMKPSVVLPPPGVLTDQVTAEFAVPVTAAENA